MGHGSIGHVIMGHVSIGHMRMTRVCMRHERMELGTWEHWACEQTACDNGTHSGNFLTRCWYGNLPYLVTFLIRQPSSYGNLPYTGWAVDRLHNGMGKRRCGEHLARHETRL